MSNKSEEGDKSVLLALLEACVLVSEEYDVCRRRAIASASPGEMDLGEEVIARVREAISKAKETRLEKETKRATSRHERGL